MEKLTDMQVWIETIKRMKAEASHPFVLSVFNEMLTELEKGDPELVETPQYLSIIRFGYNLFNPLRLKDYRAMLEAEDGK